MRTQRKVLLMMLGLAVIACRDLLQVESPLRVPATRLNDPSLAPLLVQSAIGDFECAFGDYVADVADVTDEFSSSATAAQSGVDLRLPNTLIAGLGTCSTIRGTPISGIYIPLQTARFQAEDTFARLQAWADSGAAVPTPGSTVLMATAAAYAGYAYTLFGEGFCRSVFDGGPPLTWNAVLAIAEQRFTTALMLAQQANNVDLINFASVGRARVRLDLGLLPEAAADAKVVTAYYVRNATYSSDSPRRQNQVYVHNYAAWWSTVDPRFRNLKVGAVADPRVPAFDAGRNGVDNRTRLWLSGKTPSDASPIPIATWAEAQLIIAEAEGGASAVARVNALRGRFTPPLPLYPASGDSADVIKQVLEERRRELFLQGHRLNDMLRFNLPFDSGVSPTGQTYGAMTCFQVPNVTAVNNPNCADGQCQAITR